MAGRDTRVTISGLKPRGRAGGKARTRLCARRWRYNVRDESMCTAHMVGTSPCHRRPRAPDFRGVDDEAGGGSDAWSCGHLLASCPRASPCRCQCASIGWIWAACFDPSTPPRPAHHPEQRQAGSRARRARYTRRRCAEASHCSSQSDRETYSLRRPSPLRPRPAPFLHASPGAGAHAHDPRAPFPYATSLAASMDATRTMTTKTSTLSTASPPPRLISKPRLSLCLTRTTSAPILVSATACVWRGVWCWAQRARRVVK
ncbi:hypothetical protein C8R44DRAFT_382259 [Mycena epipterygia]|nr:hypothetical protein C8R44DRAFT_382259 [Mycena epipterygia]